MEDSKLVRWIDCKLAIESECLSLANFLVVGFQEMIDDCIFRAVVVVELWNELFSSCYLYVWCYRRSSDVGMGSRVVVEQKRR